MDWIYSIYEGIDATMDTNIWIALVSGLFGGGGIKILTDYFREKVRTNSEVRLAEANQPIGHYSHLVNQLSKQIESDRTENKYERKRLEDVIERMDNKLDKCNEHHIECERRVGTLEGRLEEMSKIVANSAKIEIRQVEPVERIEVVDVVPTPIAKPIPKLD